MIDASAFVTFARRWLRVPWRHYGRDHDGVDCVGLIIGVLRESGAAAADFDAGLTEYSIAPRGPWVVRAVRANCRPLPAVVPGALVMFRAIENGWAAQCALATGSGFIAAVPKVGVIERRMQRRVDRLLHSAWALPGVSYPQPFARVASAVSH